MVQSSSRLKVSRTQEPGRGGGRQPCTEEDGTTYVKCPKTPLALSTTQKHEGAFYPWEAAIAFIDALLVRGSLGRLNLRTCLCADEEFSGFCIEEWYLPNYFAAHSKAMWHGWKESPGYMDRFNIWTGSLAARVLNDSKFALKDRPGDTFQGCGCNVR